MAVRAGVYTRLSRLKLDPDPAKAAELTRLAMLRQDEDSLKLATDRGYEVTTTYPDPGISADDKVVREVFEGALADLAEGTIDALVIPRFDRLTPRARDLATGRAGAAGPPRAPARVRRRW